MSDLKPQSSTESEYEVFEKGERALREEAILAFWDEQQIFKKTLDKDAPKGEFVFYDGPPTANGRPGIHHVESRAFKDVIPRYKTMQGFHVRRKGGWDTHGLPVELQVEKQLGLTSKKQVEEYGVAAFNTQCKESVWHYVNEWQAFSKRVGYWVDFENPYITYENNYIESLWNIVQKVDDKKLLYKDYKVLPWCPRCGTALSSHELAQGYKDVKDLSVVVKFELVDEPGTYVLAWTTTPWTLPGNVGLAVGPALQYSKVSADGGMYIMATELLQKIFKEKTYSVVETFLGAELVGKKYKALYPFLTDLITGSEKEKLENAYKIYPAEFVTTTDGTGIVHTAVMYGQEDFDLGTSVGLPKFHLVDETGNFVAGTGFLRGRFVKEVDENGKPTLAVDIIDDLKQKDFYFDKFNYEHSYPHCWRCSTPLIYFARDSWYIQMSKLSDQMVKENETINWEPAHIREGRFGEWLRGIKDWAISRERYWGTPLPIWESTDGERLIIGSFDELKQYTKKSGNTYMIMRHGEAESNVTGLVATADPHAAIHLTEKGKQQVVGAAQSVRDKKIDYIFTSPFVRTHESAILLAEQLGLEKDQVIVDERLRERRVDPSLEGAHWDRVHEAIAHMSDWYVDQLGTSESIEAIKIRAMAFLYDSESRYTGKNILIVTHGGVIDALQSGIAGWDRRQIYEKHNTKGIITVPHAEIQELSFTPLSHNERYELDVHKPFIDDVILEKDGKQFTRVREVMDVWFDSGAMPYAQDHYPFENAEWVDGPGTPADYIAEAVDQTRGWFYTLHAIATLMDRGKAFKNVVCLGHIMAADGTKMSKSKGNVVNPWEMIARHGIDPVRLWMYCVNQPGDAKNFDEKTVDELVRKVFTMLDNILHFYEMFKGDLPNNHHTPTASPHILDQWILAKTDALTEQMTSYLEQYKMLEPGRLLRDFILDMSQWYIRRSRERFKGDDAEDKAYAFATTRYVMRQLALLMAPFTPFVADELWQKIKGEDDVESVHLASWPQNHVVNTSAEQILTNMQLTRDIVSSALELRNTAGIKVRQPLARLTIATNLDEQYLELIKDEVNVKEVLAGNELVLDTTLTPELRAEGIVRDVLRQVQAMRKDAGLNPEDRIALTIDTDQTGKELLETATVLFASVAGVEQMHFASCEGERVVVDDYTFTLQVKKL